MAIEKLHTETTTSDQLQLLRDLMGVARLDQFSLVGGTALALQFGHRRSKDIDLFTTAVFDSDELARFLEKKFFLEHISATANSLTGAIRDIKIDMIAHRYDLIDSPITVDGIRMLGLKDLAALKLNAITNRGSRKDFWDCAELLERWSMERLLEFYAQKYPHTNLWQVQKSLCYFEDAELEPDPEVLKPRTWTEVKDIICTNCRF